MMEIHCVSVNLSKEGEEGLSSNGMVERDQLFLKQFPACPLNPADKEGDRILYNRAKQQSSSLSKKLAPSP